MTQPREDWYRIPQKVIDMADILGISVEAIVSYIALRYGPEKYRDQIRAELEAGDLVSLIEMIESEMEL